MDVLEGKKQTAFSHSSAEFEIISLDAGLRMDGLPALQFYCHVKQPRETLSVIRAI